MSPNKQRLTHDEHRYLTDSKKAMLGETPRFAMITLLLFVIIIFTTLIWAYFTLVDIAVVAQGKVVASSNLQAIENLEGGIVSAISVDEGQHVKKGDILLKLDDTRFAAAYKRDLVRQATLDMDMIRLRAEANGDDELVIPENLNKNFPDIVKNTSELFHKNKSAIDSTLALLRKSEALLKKELDIVKPLAEKGAMSQLETIRLERELTGVQTQIHDKIQDLRVNSRNQLNRTKGDYDLLTQELTASEDRSKRTVLRSPLDGVVNKIYITNIGEVVNPGDKLMDILPGDKQLSILVKVSPSDIGFIKVGQKTNIKISAYDYTIYGPLKGVVNHISADAISDKDGNDYFEVKINADQNYIEAQKKHLPIMPGMSVTANIITGKRSVLSYLIRPFYDLRDISKRMN